MTESEQVAKDLEQVLSAPPNAPSKDDLGVVLATGLYLDKKILEGNQSPRLLESVKDAAGNLYIRKYEKLIKAIWQKYRAKPECHPLHFICESPIFVIENVNISFLLPEDFQFLGSLYAQWGNDMVADQFFMEALKANTADAFINAGVFRYRRGERGVVDNFYVAKKHFNKALSILHQMPLTVDEKYQRRKLCNEAIDEIEYRFAPLIDKFFRFIIRLLTLKFETDVPYIGAASPKEPQVEKLRQLTDGIHRREFDLKREAARKFLAELHEKVPVGQSHLEAEIQEIETEFGQFPTPELLEIAVSRIGEFYLQNMPLLERGSGALSDAAMADVMSSSVDSISFQMADLEEIEKISAKHKLTSLGELVDLASKPVIEPAAIAFLIRSKMDQTAIMERLFHNPVVPNDVKQLIQQHHSFPG